MKTFLKIISVLMVPMALGAHGEDKLGPNGGYLKMPGGFHTEVKVSGQNLLVYLLDINWQNPVTEKSSVEVEYQNAGKSFKISCSPKDQGFVCALPKAFHKNKGTLKVLAERQGMKGSSADYVLPLKLAKPAKVVDEHSGHH